MKKILSLILISAFSLSMAAAIINYTADHETIFPNPERGFTDQINDVLSDSKPSLLKNREYYFQESGERETQRLVVLVYYLTNYRTKEISAKVLEGFDTDMQILRKYGFKCVLRFAYSSDDNNDTSVEWTQKHIAQLKPYWQKNADVIYVLEAGFVGQWGEWYYSKNHGNETQHMNDNRRAILSTLIDACPADRFLLVRYPLIKIQYLNDQQALTTDQAFTQTTRARIGHHNDAFLNEWGNDGTYGWDGEGLDDDPALRTYIAQETRFVPNGGETNVEESSWAKEVYDDAETEMRKYHWSFCGAEYAEQITDRWRSSGIFDQLDKYMGYRFQLLYADWEERVNIGQALPIHISLQNTGYAPLYNARTVYLVLQSDTQTYSFPLDTDPRTWVSEARSITIKDSVLLPDTMAIGNYRLYLHLPDAHPSLANDPRYAIRLANQNTWNPTTGWNDLGVTIELLPSTQAIESVSTQAPAVRKTLHNGQIRIHRGEKVYTALGERLE